MLFIVVLVQATLYEKNVWSSSDTVHVRTCMFRADVQEFLGLVMHETYMYMYIGT